MLDEARRLLQNLTALTLEHRIVIARVATGSG
jgi:hypothetical protein